MRKPLYQEAQQRLRDYILDHQLTPGAGLPPEGELANELGISRLSLREATKSLETLGVIKAVPGRGLYVSTFSFDAVVQQLPYSFGIGGHSLTELLQVREAIEGGLIVAVSTLMTEADLAELDGIVDEMAAAHARGETFAEVDRRFHVRLFAPLDNGLVTTLLELFWDLFHKLESELPAGDQHSVDVHRDILAAIRGGDARQMMRSVREHFGGIRRSLDARSSSASQENQAEDT
ncbi:FadR family transcriptional regulator [Phytoactinopolyspora alkaliphila]|uniref:FadR family transcriptional regulator n=1 Tax=Phytoactinopolyspora alkaliphila TaxID=1783498 RepID=A0A6N9YIR2_9ACTN|nr:FadR/GntR family transcriptional regulator [Phytoactinopolyspora alkaliphila]NED94825.1 FadR family transcriptional regulator [Phytoactinopolyspora alkaliphila]